jgi:predicted Rossmann fold flavoprotein
MDAPATCHSPPSTPHHGNRIAIIGGGAAGFFTALTVAEVNPQALVSVYELGKRTLTKVKISGGGRCNVTHSCFDPGALAKHYPRGSKELRSAFHRWQPQDTIQWFANRGVRLKTEADGRMFPVTDASQTIIDCFERNASKAGVSIHKNLGLAALTVEEGRTFSLQLSDGQCTRADRVCIAAGSLKSSKLTGILAKLGHTVEPLAPSLFAFNLSDKRTHGLAGISVQNASVQTPRKGSAQKGPILITHRGLSGPAILRLSAWEARDLQTQNYHFDVTINWLGDVSEHQLRDQFSKIRKSSGKTLLKTKVFATLPKRLWERLLEYCEIDPQSTWAQLPKNKESKLIRELVCGVFPIQGKTTNKDEFVTCGGVRRKEIDWRTMESKIVPNLYFAGECIDYDGITGGFNFRGAWTTGRIAGLAMAD